MSITLTTLWATTRVHLADSQCADAPFWADADLTVYINEAINTIWGLLPDDALRLYEAVANSNLTSGTATYALPTDFFCEYTIIYNGIPCRKCRYSDKVIWEAISFIVSSASQPVYYVNNTAVGLMPTPSAASTSGLGVYYLKVPDALAAGANTIDLDPVYEQIIAKLAAGRALSIKASVSEGKVLIDSTLEDLKLVINKDKKEETE